MLRKRILIKAPILLPAPKPSTKMLNPRWKACLSKFPSKAPIISCTFGTGEPVNAKLGKHCSHKTHNRVTRTPHNKTIDNPQTTTKSLIHTCFANHELFIRYFKLLCLRWWWYRCRRCHLHFWISKFYETGKGMNAQHLTSFADYFMENTRTMKAWSTGSTPFT